MAQITKEQYQELLDAEMYDKDELHRLLKDRAGIKAEPYTAYLYYDAVGNYLGDSNDTDVESLLWGAGVEIKR